MPDNVATLGDGWRRNVEKAIIKDADTDTSANVVVRGDGNNALCVDVSSSTSVQNIRVQDGDGTDLADVVVRPDTKKALCVDVSSDIEIGAVELKNATDNTRAVIKSDGVDNALVVMSNDLDIRDLTFSTDKVDVSGSSVTVSSTDLDIRDIDNATDDILIYGYDGANNQPIKTDVNGELQVDVLSYPRAETPTIYAISLTNKDTEYSQVLPNGTKRFAISLRNDKAFRIAFETGKVATPTDPYLMIKGNTEYSEQDLNLSGKTLYIASYDDNQTAQLIVWS